MDQVDRMSAIPLRVPSSTCIGRDRELAQLRERFDEASQLGERLVLIRGPAGVGKTRLMSEFRSQMRLEGAVVLEGRCTSGARALAPLREIMQRALSFLEEVGRASTLDLGAISFLISNDAPKEPTQSGMTLLEQRVQFFEAYCRLLRDLSRIKPPIVLVHDLQWADAATIELLTHLLDGAGPWLDTPKSNQTMHGLVVASVREGQAPSTLRSLENHPKAEALSLGGFDEAAMSEFLQSPDVVKRLLKATGGNPEELLALVETPALGSDRIMSRRLESIDADSRAILAALAALGRPSTARLVAQVARLKNIAKPLAELIDLGLVKKSIHDGAVLLRPGRHRYADMVYGELAVREQTKLHQRIVDIFADAQGLAAQDVATHAIKAGDREKAVDASLEASAALEQTFAYEAAISLLVDASPLATPQRRAAIDRRLAELYTHTGSYERALEHAKRVVEESTRDLEAHLRVARLRALGGDYDGADADLTELEGPAHTQGDESLLLELAATRAEVHFRRGDYDEALAVAQTANLESNPAAVLALANTRGKIELARGEYSKARKTFDQNLERARQAELVREQAQSIINTAIVALREHDHDAATRGLEEALTLARRAGALRESAIALENLAVLAHFRRDYKTALDCYHAAVGDLKKLGNRAMLARAANNLGELYLRLGDKPRAAKLGEFARHMAGDEPPQAIIAEGLLLKARVAIESNSPAEARAALLEAAEVFGNLGEESRRLEAELLLVKLDVDKGDITSARARLDEARLSEGLDQVRRGEAALLEADLERASFGNPLRAILVAVDCFDRANDPERLWRAHLKAALIMRESHDSAGYRRHLEKAADIERAIAATVPQNFIDNLRNDSERVVLYEALSETSGLGTSTAATRDKSTEPVEKQRPSSENQRPPTAPMVQRTRDPLIDRFPKLIFQSDVVRQVLELVERVAVTDSIVLIRGESGTGKELIADSIHRLSARSSRPFVKVNCAALVETLLLSELFGHEKGAFTGAMQRRVGRFEAADGGTLFLDEIGDISPKTQVSLLRVLQEQRFERVGGSTPITTNVRIICATNRDLEELVRQGTFREDLYYRLKGIQVTVPPLRERREDVELLAHHFLALSAKERGEPTLGLSDKARSLLVAHGWPGNVRELENVMRSASLFADGTQLEARHLTEFTEIAPSTSDNESTKIPTGKGEVSAPQQLREPVAEEPLPQAPPIDGVCDEVVAGDISLADMKKKVEQHCIEIALDKTEGNITQAAALLGMKRPRLSQLVKEYGLLRRERRVKS